jgi:hypothetical protein
LYNNFSKTIERKEEKLQKNEGKNKKKGINRSSVE